MYSLKDLVERLLIDANLISNLYPATFACNKSFEGSNNGVHVGMFFCRCIGLVNRLCAARYSGVPIKVDFRILIDLKISRREMLNGGPHGCSESRYVPWGLDLALQQVLDILSLAFAGVIDT